METIRLREAILVYSARIGVKVKDQDVAKMLWPDSQVEAQRLNMSKLVNGVTRRVDVPMILRICEKLGVDANFLFGMTTPMTLEETVLETHETKQS